MANNDQAIRAVKILEMLRSETDESHTLSRNDICSRLAGCGLSGERRTFYRDIGALKEAGYDIETFRSGRSVGYYLVEQSFSVAELKLIVDALHGANFLTEKKTLELAEKVAALGGKYKAEDIKANNIRFNTRKHSNEAVLTVIEQLNSAIKGRQKISCTVFDLGISGNPVYRHEKKLYVLEPLALIHHEDNYYLLCYDNERGIYPRRIDRINNVDVLNEKISPQALSKLDEAEKYTNGIFKMFGGERIKVVLEFKKEALNCIFDHFGENTPIAETDKPGVFRTEVEVEESPTFWGWLFQFAGEMRIVSPESLAEKYINRLKTGNRLT